MVVLIVNAGDEALVGDPEQGQARGLVDARDLASIMPIFDLVGHSEPWRPPMRFGSRRSSTGSLNCLPLRATGKPSSKRTEILQVDFDIVGQEATPYGQRS